MSEGLWSRRRFLHVGALGVLGAACARRDTTTQPSLTPSPTSPLPTTPASTPTHRPLTWRRLDARGPEARRDHTLTGTPEGAILFGGRSDNQARADLWLYDGEWQEFRAEGPAARFGHNAIFTADGSLWIFGGQRGSDFFNDVWRFDVQARRWLEESPAGSAPTPRYGASGAAFGDDLIVSHGFTFQGRFDDTRRLRARAGSARWADLTPGDRPVERCLHRAAPVGDSMLLFGGQTDGQPFLGDTWVFDLEQQAWREIPGDGPPARNLYALVGVDDQAYLFGGFAADGAVDDTWRWDGAAWRALSPQGDAPAARGGVEGALVGDRAMLVFGGSDGTRELDDLWELTLPD